MYVMRRIIGGGGGEQFVATILAEFPLKSEEYRKNVIKSN